MTRKLLYELFSLLPESYRTWLLLSICSESSSVIRELSAANRTWRTSIVHEKVHLGPCHIVYTLDDEREKARGVSDLFV